VFDIFFYILTKTEFDRQKVVKIRKIKLHDKSSSGNRLVSCRRTERWAVTQQLIVAVSNCFANAPNEARKVSFIRLEYEVIIRLVWSNYRVWLSAVCRKASGDRIFV
jgi:hypothetical protein